jgi:hypothetical protein
VLEKEGGDTYMKFPIANHPLFDERWNDYSKKFNQLAEILDENGLDSLLLRDVVEAVKAVEELAGEVGYITGLMQGLLAGGARNELSCTR